MGRVLCCARSAVAVRDGYADCTCVLGQSPAADEVAAMSLRVSPVRTCCRALPGIACTKDHHKLSAPQRGTEGRGRSDYQMFLGLAIVSVKYFHCYQGWHSCIENEESTDPKEEMRRRDLRRSPQKFALLCVTGCSGRDQPAALRLCLQCLAIRVSSNYSNAATRGLVTSAQSLGSSVLPPNYNSQAYAKIEYSAYLPPSAPDCPYCGLSP